MIDFVHNGVRYHIEHNDDDDSRSVVQLPGRCTEVLLKFDSSLNVLAPSGLVVGRLRGFTEQRTEDWVLVKQDGSITNLNVPVRDYHWKNILLAEVEAAKVLL